MKGKNKMSDLKKYVAKRKKEDPEFAENYDVGYLNFKIGVLLKEMREKSGLTQEELAKKLKTKKSVISRIENHSEDIKLSTLGRYARTLGRRIRIEVE
jgi:HTH-type transcriptional regulator/antitoxin HipB